MVLLALQGLQVPLERLVRQVPKVHRVSREIPGLQALQGQPEPLDQRVTREILVQPVPKVYRVQPVQQVRRVQPDHKGLKV